MGTYRCARVFSHSDAKDAAQMMKCQERTKSHRGCGGRMADALASGEARYTTFSYSISGGSLFSSGKQTHAMYIPSSGATTTLRNRDQIGDWVSNISGVQYANVISDAFASKMKSSVLENDKLAEEMKAATLVNGDDFPGTTLGKQLKQVARLMNVREKRGAARDIFYVTVRGWDTHGNLFDTTHIGFSEINGAIGAFVGEIEAQGLFEKMVLLCASEFGRTLSSNGRGTDHGWSGNYFVLGGAINGGRFFGKYPDTLHNSPKDVRRGRLIPAHPWESILAPIAEWMGVDSSKLNDVFPNLANFDWSENIHTDVFKP